jgi:hypothetical protein
MTKTTKSETTPRWWAASAGLGAAACAVCCLGPGLAAVGIGAGTVVAAGAAGEWLGFLLLSLAGVVGMTGIVVWRRARRGSSASAGATGACAVDGSCGCIGGGAASSRHDDVVSCTLEPDQMPRRLEDFRALVVGALVAREHTPGRFVWIFRRSPETEAAVRRLAEAERRCCSFFRFEITTDERAVRWVATAPPPGWPLLEMLYRVSDGLNVGGPLDLQSVVFAGAR